MFCPTLIQELILKYLNFLNFFIETTTLKIVLVSWILLPVDKLAFFQLFFEILS